MSRSSNSSWKQSPKPSRQPQTADISPNISPLEAALAVPPSAAGLPGLASPLLLPRSQEGPDSIAAVTSTLDSDGRRPDR